MDELAPISDLTLFFVWVVGIAIIGGLAELVMRWREYRRQRNGK